MPWNAGPGLGYTEVQRVIALRGKLFVGGDHDDRVVVLDADLDVAEAVLLEQRCLPQRGLDERLGGGLAVLRHEPLVQRAGVDADADRDARVARGLGDLLDPAVELLDVAGVDAHGGAAGVDRGEDVLGLEVDVGDHRNGRLCLAIAGSASASSCRGQATRTMSQPEAVSSAICCSVELMS